MSERTDLPRYLQKTFTGITEFYKMMMDRFKTDYRETIEMPNFADPAFGAVEAGIAMAYKLMATEFMAAQIDMYFNRGMIRRLELYSDVYNAGTKKIDINDYRATMTAKRNVPIDVKSIVEAASALSMMVSGETLLEYLPNQIVPDVMKEMERIKLEKETAMLEVPTMGDIDGEGVVDLDVIQDSDLDAVVLNGAQVQAAQKIASDVAAGLLPRESGLQLIMALGIPREQAELIVPKEGKKAAE